jgi:hypothetical protein
MGKGIFSLLDRILPPEEIARMLSIPLLENHYLAVWGTMTVGLRIS